MKAGLILALFVLSTLVFVASEQNGMDQVKVELSAEQFGIVPEIGFSEKLTNTSERIFFRVMIEKYFGNPSPQNNELATIFFKSYLERTIGLTPLKRKHFRRIVVYTKDKQDIYNLS